MSKRAERRAAARAAHQPANRETAAAAQAAAHHLPFDLDGIYAGDEDPIDPELLAILDRVHAASDSAPTEAQIKANRENAKLSTGPTSPTGKMLVSQNRRTHGLIGRFILQAGESPIHYQELVDEVYAEYQPHSASEFRLAHSLVQHYWLMQRAILLQEQSFADDRKLALYMRYQTTHERSYYKAQKELQTLLKERRHEKIGFESQTRQNEARHARSRLAHAQAHRIEIATACRQVIEHPSPAVSGLALNSERPPAPSLSPASSPVNE